MTRQTAAPRGAIPNWAPATTFEDYARNCQEGLEEYSDRRMAKILGWSRIELYRAKLMAEIPEALFEQLLAHGCGPRIMADLALAARTDAPPPPEMDLCPHCRGVIRVRPRVPERARKAIRAWLDAGA